ncbi:interleukin-17 receptor B [Mauremys mutica]|uniref:interleukin-17 receptor B n=1 Tax=Mauremys mutica TaxID=74926 RepID=UPI001D1600D4|nr:interleukin-17 receptor B [Mauremys mutica]
MTLAVGILLILVLSSCGSWGQDWPSIKCGFETGPAHELRKWHSLTPADLHNLSAQLIETEVDTHFRSYLINISWSLSMDASIKELTATKICVMSKGIREHFECIRCNYTEKFQSQTMLGNRRWQFHYIGFPVEPEMFYSISAYNLPPANIYEDSPSKSIKLTSPGCKDNVMKYSKSCIEVGSLWNPNITACKIEAEVEVNFTTSSLGTKYTILLYECEKCDVPIERDLTTKINETRTSVRIPVSDQSNNISVQIIPYFAKCKYDCRRHKGTLTCVQNHSNGSITIDSTGRYVCFILVALFVTVCVIAAVVFFRNHGTKKIFFHHAELQQPVKVLVIYPKEVCFQHTVLAFAEFLQKHCQSDVIIDMWQKRRIAEQGPVQWLAIQKEIADKIIFLSSRYSITECDAVCHESIGNHKDNSECMFTLAFNFFCSDMKNISSLHKYMVVSFNEINSKDTLPSALNSCPKYCLMKDIDIFCRDLSSSNRQAHGTNRTLVCGWSPTTKCIQTEEYNILCSTISTRSQQQQNMIL